MPSSRKRITQLLRRVQEIFLLPDPSRSKQELSLGHRTQHFNLLLKSFLWKFSRTNQASLLRLGRQPPACPEGVYKSPEMKSPPDAAGARLSPSLSTRRPVLQPTVDQDPLPALRSLLCTPSISSLTISTARPSLPQNVRVHC